MKFLVYGSVSSIHQNYDFFWWRIKIMIEPWLNCNWIFLKKLIETITYPGSNQFNRLLVQSNISTITFVTLTLTSTFSKLTVVFNKFKNDFGNDSKIDSIRRQEVGVLICKLFIIFIFWNILRRHKGDGYPINAKNILMVIGETMRLIHNDGIELVP